MSGFWRTRQRHTLRSRTIVALLVVGALTGAIAVGALAQGAGKSGLIGKLEGPEVVTDPAKFPKSLKEAPQLAALVKAGKLPPVAERVGQDPLVIKPLHEVGKYGGTWRGGFTGPADFWNGFRCCSGPDHLLFWDYTGDKVTPNIAKGYEMQDGGRTLVLHLRRGMKWSDGKPFTADDFVFWFQDIYQNKDLVPTPSAAMAINGKQGVIEKVDTGAVLHAARRAGGLHRPRRACLARLRRARRVRPGPLPEAVPAQVRRAGRARQEGQGREVRQLGADVPGQERLGA
jgi:peptide/nickel transport system substrate-binding protein